jgi:hypothetical protein
LIRVLPEEPFFQLLSLIPRAVTVAAKRVALSPREPRAYPLMLHPRECWRPRAPAQAVGRLREARSVEFCTAHCHMDIPLTEFVGFLKQLDAARLGAGERETLARALPLFWPAEPPFTAAEVKARAKQQIGEIVEGKEWETLVQKGPNRRFSGGEGLPRQRYHTLTRDNAGEDNLTLLAEMRAYRSCRSGMVCAILDSIYPPGKTVLKAERIEPHGNTVLLVFLDPASLARTLITLPYTVIETRIPRVLDLRLLEAQQWFFSAFYLKESNTLHYPIQDSPIEEFASLLPYLMSMEVGGGGYTEGIGRFLRQNQVNALVYPSARNDVWAHQENGRLIDWCGWCLVDYRGAATSDAKLLDVGEQTPFTFPQPTLIRTWNEGPHRGSWGTEGVRQLYRYRYFVELSQVFGETKFRPVMDALLQLEGGADDFWKFASEYTNPLP